MNLKIIPLLLIGIFLCVFSFGQQSKTLDKDSIPVVKSKESNEVLLEYEKTLKDEQKDYYDMIKTLLGAVVIVGGGIFTWMNWKSREDISKQVNQQFKENIQGLIDKKIAEIDEIIKNNREASRKQLDEIKQKSDKQFEDINKIILELSAKTDKVGQANPKDAAVFRAEKNDVDKLKNKEVLWVDDHPGNNDYPRQILQQAGIKFTLALSTDDAIDFLSKEKFDLVISDMGREADRKAGIELIKEMKKKNFNTPVVIYASSKAIENFGNEAKALGAIAVTTGYSGILTVVQQFFQS